MEFIVLGLAGMLVLYLISYKKGKNDVQKEIAEEMVEQTKRANKIKQRVHDKSFRDKLRKHLNK